MERPIKSLIFNTVQLDLFSHDDVKWLHIHTYGEGQMTTKFDLSKSKIATNLPLDLKDPVFPSFWQISSSNFRLKIKLKKLDNSLIKGSITIFLFGFLPIYWCWLSGKHNLFNELHKLNRV